MPTCRGNEYEEASEIAEVVLENALNYVDRALKPEARRGVVDTLITQHVKVQLAILQNRWSRDDKNKTVAALEGMGNGLSSLGAAGGKHSLHVKLVQS